MNNQEFTNVSVSVNDKLNLLSSGKVNYSTREEKALNGLKKIDDIIENKWKYNKDQVNKLQEDVGKDIMNLKPRQLRTIVYKNPTLANTDQNFI